MVKSTIRTIVCVAVCIAALSCSKEGKFKPSERISKVYEGIHEEYDYNGHHVSDGEHLAEGWSWDGKKLSSITYYNSNNEVTRKLDFEYDGSQIKRAINRDENTTTEFVYDGRQLVSANIKNGSTTTNTLTFTHNSDKKISRIEGQNVGTATSESQFMVDAMMQNMLPDMQIEQYVSKAISTKSSSKWTVSLEYSGDNISQATIDYGSGKPIVVKMTYDSQKNPHQNFVYLLTTNGDFDCSMALSKNNVVSYTRTEGSSTKSRTYEYTYDGSWPTKRSYTITFDGNLMHSVTTYFTRYEYL